MPKAPSSPAPCVKRFIALINENNNERPEHADVPHLPAFTPQKLIGRHVFHGAAEDHPSAVTWNTWDSSKPTTDDRPLEEADLRWNTLGGLSRDHRHARQGREQNVISEHLYEHCT
ncbi:unnamed protein product [Lymnaea stagnalis]|uniref:Uncharacterized protein n=1 Tax=Lymnaea stagnalis TaxID=6523 RepID=A0AAV2IFS4_LYMST